MIKVKKGVQVTDVTEEALNRYLSQGWKRVSKKEASKPKTYKDYTKDQLTSIASNRKIRVTARMKKQEIIDALLEQDKRSKKEPTNMGFDDDLIK